MLKITTSLSFFLLYLNLNSGLSSSLGIIVCHHIHCSNCTDLDDIHFQCGSDGVTYFNLCELECAKENCYKDLVANHSGICDDNSQFKINSTSTIIKEELKTPKTLCDSESNCNCNYDLSLTCGTDRKTYPNPCALECATKCNKDLKILHYGGCY